MILSDIFLLFENFIFTNHKGSEKVKNDAK